MDKTRSVLKNTLRIVLIILAVLIVFRIGQSIAKGGKKPAELVYNVAAVKLETRQIAKYFAVQGVIEGDPQVKVFPTVPGKFSRNAVAEGSYVNKGDVLVYIDRDMVGYQYELAPVTAPVGGMVTKLYCIDRGEAVSPAMPVAEIADPSKLKLVFNAGQEDLVKIKKGQKAVISFVEDASLSVRGEVYSVPPVIDNDIMSGTVVVKAPNTGNKLKLGMSVNAEILIEDVKGFMVPEKAVIMTETGDYIFTVSEGKAKQTTVKAGYRNKDMIEISGEGIAAGTEVVTDGTFKLSDGVLISTGNEPPKPAEDTNSKKEDKKSAAKKDESKAQPEKK